MTKVMIDATTRSKLLDLTQPMEFCDESGRLLGRFTPFNESSSEKGIEPQLTEEELQRREQEPDYSTAEMLAYLEKL
jgi:hypothetical protein